MDPVTQLGYCPTCVDELPPDVRERVTRLPDTSEEMNREAGPARPTEKSVGGGLLLWYNTEGYYQCN